MPHAEEDVPTVRASRPHDRPQHRRRPNTVRIGGWVRVLLAVMTLGLTMVFAIATALNPYMPDGSPRTMETHRQLGLPPCNMVVMTGKPCPSCGMTTSFSLLMHGDVVNSLKANWAGTLLAVFWLGLIPWGIIGAVRGRLLWVKNGELFLTISVGVVLAVTFVRWGIVLLTG